MKIALTLANMLVLTDADLADMNREELTHLSSKLTNKILALNKTLPFALYKAIGSSEYETYSLLVDQQKTLINIRQTVNDRLS